MGFIFLFLDSRDAVILGRSTTDQLFPTWSLSHHHGCHCIPVWLISHSVSLFRSAAIKWRIEPCNTVERYCRVNVKHHLQYRVACLISARRAYEQTLLDRWGVNLLENCYYGRIRFSGMLCSSVFAGTSDNNPLYNLGNFPIRCCPIDSPDPINSRESQRLSIWGMFAQSVQSRYNFTDVGRRCLKKTI